MNQKSLPKIIWLLIALSLAFFCLYKAVSGSPEAQIVPALFLVVISSPLGFLTSVLLPFIGIDKLLNESLHIANALQYFLIILSGYLQWFFIFPRLIETIKKRVNCSNKTSL